MPSADSTLLLEGNEAELLSESGETAVEAPAAAVHGPASRRRRRVLQWGGLLVALTCGAALWAAGGRAGSPAGPAARGARPLDSLGLSAGSETSPAESPMWEVVNKGHVFVRDTTAITAKVLGKKPTDTRVVAVEADGWLQLLGEPGYIKVALDVPRITLMKRRPLAFASVASGTCTAAGKHEIQDALTCMAAAVALTPQAREEGKAPATAFDDDGGCSLHGAKSRLCCAGRCPAPTTPTVTTTTKTSGTTTTPYPTTTAPSGEPSLFCFAVIRAFSYEINLLRALFKNGGSLYGCNQWVVYSDTKAWLGANNFSIAIPGPPATFTNIWLNTDVFFRAWDKITAARDYEKHAWTVKVDPDAVFIPQRLRQHLRQGNYGWNARVYLKNCAQFHSMQGPLEVFSRASVEVLGTDSWKCKQQIDRTKVGEDGFLQKCMGVLGVGAVDDFSLLSDQYCGQQPRPCTDKWVVAFHPFKPRKDYFSCMKNASQYVGPDWS